MSTSSDKILSEFIDAWNAGSRPSPDEYLARVPDHDRDELAEQLQTWLIAAPTPAYSKATLSAIGQEPAFAHAMALIDDERGALAVELPRLRRLTGMSIGDLAGRIVEAFKLGAGDRARAVEYLEGVETGRIQPDGLSRRLLDVLGDAVGATGERLAQAAAIGPSPRTAGSLFFRKDGESAGWLEEDLQVLADAAFAPAPEGGEPDELDRLFYGGIDA